MKKILVTLGPSSMNGDIIRQISEYGVELLRINLSHTALDEVERCINIIRAHTNVPICLDSEGAQIRNQKIKGGSVHFEKDTEVKIHYGEVLGDAENISFTPSGIAEFFQTGDIIKIDFHLAALQVIGKHGDHCLAKVITSGTVGSNKAVDANRELPLPPITEKDRQAIGIGREMGVRNYALSFANKREDVIQFRSLVGEGSKIICKIESRHSLLNLEAILSETDEILIDRGDLSRQIDIEKIPFLQRRIISTARIMDRPVSVATNLLESMINNRMPTRAEVNDVVSTILMGANGLVLAAETAIGQYPVQSVEIISNIIAYCRKWTPNTNISEILEM